MKAQQLFFDPKKIMIGFLLRLAKKPTAFLTSVNAQQLLNRTSRAIFNRLSKNHNQRYHNNPLEHRLTTSLANENLNVKTGKVPQAWEKASEQVGVF